METNLFANATFNFAWEMPLKISLFEEDFSIVVSADAYFPSDEITEEQAKAYKSFLENYNEIIANTEQKLIEEGKTKENALDRFIPKMLKIKRNGDFGIVFDDKEDFENGLVVTIKPKYELMSTDEYF